MQRIWYLISVTLYVWKLPGHSSCATRNLPLRSYSVEFLSKMQLSHVATALFVLAFTTPGNSVSPCNCYISIFDNPLSTGDPLTTPPCDVVFSQVLDFQKCLSVAQSYSDRLGLAPYHAFICSKQTDPLSCTTEEPPCSDIPCQCLESCQTRCSSQTDSKLGMMSNLGS
jgi:hypothetical protein